MQTDKIKLEIHSHTQTKMQDKKAKNWEKRNSKFPFEVSQWLGNN